MKKLALLAFVLLVAVPASSSAHEVKGLWGLGYFRPEAPIGFRYWASDKVGIDVGVGFDNVKPDKGTGSTSQNSRVFVAVLKVQICNLQCVAVEIDAPLRPSNGLPGNYLQL